MCHKKLVKNICHKNNLRNTKKLRGPKDKVQNKKIRTILWKKDKND